MTVNVVGGKWTGPVRRYDIVKEFMIALVVVTTARWTPC
jgi:hypothetical protein